MKVRSFVIAPQPRGSVPFFFFSDYLLSIVEIG